MDSFVLQAFKFSLPCIHVNFLFLLFNNKDIHPPQGSYPIYTTTNFSPHHHLLLPTHLILSICIARHTFITCSFNLSNPSLKSPVFFEGMEQRNSADLKGQHTPASFLKHHSHPITFQHQRLIE